MPGVPSGRGCDACRKQKKKCDQSKPACSRCTRLQIPCIGSGEQRYKFKNQTLSKALQPYNATSTQKINTINTIIRVPENPTTNLLNAYVTRLNVSDIRFDLSCYGTFLAEIPKRLGRSAALDASVHALTVCSTCVYSKNQSVDMLKAYVDALKTLRRSICNPATSQAPDTLCAIYLMLVCQGWMGNPDDSPTSHGEGIAHILKQGSAERWKEAFEVEMMMTLCVPVILESIHNPRIQLNAWFWKILDQYGPPTTSTCEEFTEPGRVPRMGFQSMKFRNIAKIAEFVHFPAANLHEIEMLYRHMQCDQGGMRKVLDDFKMAADPTDFASPGPKAQSHKMVRDFSTAYGILLTLMLILNGILQAFNPEDATLIAEAVILGEDTLSLGQELQKYRPLGASYIPLCLAIAWAAVNDPIQRAKMKIMMEDYQSDFTQTRWMDMAIWWEKKLELMGVERLISQMNSESAAMALVGRDPIDVDVGTDACCVQ